MTKQATKQAAASEAEARQTTSPTHEQIAAQAYELWQARGCPEGSAEEDWFNAEKALAAKSAA